MNREIAGGGGATLYPLTGDVDSNAGSNSVSVVGLNNTPLQTSQLSSGSKLQYIANANAWVSTLVATVQVNGITISDDPTITVNVNRPIKVNGV
jgi:hypothetical protein